MENYLRREDFFKDAGVPLAVIRRAPQPPFPLHSHEFAELVIAYQGRGIHFTEDIEREIMAGNVFMLHGNIRHGYRRLENLALVNLIFLPESIAGLGIFPALQTLLPRPGEVRGEELAPVLRLDPSELMEAMALVEMMEKEEREKKNAYRVMMTSGFLQLLALLLRRRQTVESPGPRQHLSETMRYIENHFQDEISLSDLARIGKVSTSTMTRYFYRHTGFTPMEYLINYRIKKACAALVTAPEKSIAEVGFESGFSDSNYFTRVFRQKTGKSPREFRQSGTLAG